MKMKFYINMFYNGDNDKKFCDDFKCDYEG